MGASLTRHEAVVGVHVALDVTDAQPAHRELRLTLGEASHHREELLLCWQARVDLRELKKRVEGGANTLGVSKRESGGKARREAQGFIDLMIGWMKPSAEEEALMNSKRSSGE